jgi:hypothetical protein
MHKALLRTGIVLVAATLVVVQTPLLAGTGTCFCSGTAVGYEYPVANNIVGADNWGWTTVLGSNTQCGSTCQNSAWSFGYDVCDAHGLFDEVGYVNLLWGYYFDDWGGGSSDDHLNQTYVCDDLS